MSEQRSAKLDKRLTLVAKILYPVYLLSQLVAYLAIAVDISFAGYHSISRQLGVEQAVPSYIVRDSHLVWWNVPLAMTIIAVGLVLRVAGLAMFDGREG